MPPVGAPRTERKGAKFLRKGQLHRLGPASINARGAFTSGGGAGRLGVGGDACEEGVGHRWVYAGSGYVPAEPGGGGSKKPTADPLSCNNYAVLYISNRGLTSRNHVGHRTSVPLLDGGSTKPAVDPHSTVHIQSWTNKSKPRWFKTITGGGNSKFPLSLSSMENPGIATSTAMARIAKTLHKYSLVDTIAESCSDIGDGFQKYFDSVPGNEQHADKQTFESMTYRGRVSRVLEYYKSSL
ncbi:hypothetical protein FPV67DRAFT_1445616 [Lyophyllum atratum]|nr:hypothetical protein FPV67DRAFT_1445616 [Lyophyllum atratum]